MYKRADGRIVWKDTSIWPAAPEHDAAHALPRYIGGFMVHCHILVHADLGMAETMEIVAPRLSHDHVDDPPAPTH